MGSYLLRRLASLVPAFVGITLVTFLLLEILPGRELVLSGGSESGLPSRAAVEAARRAYRLDEPLLVRYLEWARRLLHWDLGESLLDGRSVSRIIQEAAPPTLLLNLVALTIAFGLSLPLGAGWARRRGALSDRAGAAGIYLLYAFPSFAAALLLRNLLSLQWGLLPLQGMTSLPASASLWRRSLDLGAHMVLPAFCLTYGTLAYLARFARANFLEVMGKEYLLAGRARGIPESALTWRHALRNTAIPILTLFGLLIPALLSGSVLVETIFSWPGIGRLYITSLLNRDFPVVMGLTTVSALLGLGGTLLSDILYTLADPRVRFEGGSDAR